MKFYLTIILALMLFAMPAYAQWEYGGKIIGQYSYYTSHLVVANIGQGNIVVAWNGPYYIQANLIDSAGYARWGEGGLTVYSDENTRRDYAALLPDNHGGVYIVWSDWRHTWAQGVALYGQHLDSLGNKLWAVDGQRLTADTMSHGSPKLFSDGQGGIIIVYESSHYQYDIGAQRVDSLGHILWDSTGISLVTLPSSQQWYPVTCRSAEREYITCWEDTRNEPDYGTDIYMQRFDINGNIYWSSTGLPVVHWADDQTYLDNSYDIASDGQGGVVIVWVDHRHFRVGNWVLYADRFSSAGQSLWQLNGKKLGNEYDNLARECQAFHFITPDVFLFRWGPGNMKLTYVGLDGSIWGEPVELDRYEVDQALASPDGILTYAIFYDGPVRTGRKCDIYGQQMWPNHPFISTYRVMPCIVSDGFGGMIAVWGSDPPADIKISRIYANGYVGGFDTLTAVEEQPVPLPEEIILFPNYPNPFNGVTTLPYQQSGDGAVALEVFDITGQSILRQEIQGQKGGVNRIILDLKGLSSGIYIARLMGERGVSNSIKLLLVK